ncbi:MAG: ACT domain-containing protein [Halothermotrichaceae bacterium]
MLIKQISVFLENKSGRLAEVAKILEDNNIDLIAITISDTTDFGILRFIANKPEQAKKVLKDNGLTVNLTNVIAISVADKPGGLAVALDVLADQSIGIEYMYAVGKDTNGAVVILKVDNTEKAISNLQDNNIKVILSKKIYEL